MRTNSLHVTFIALIILRATLAFSQPSPNPRGKATLSGDRITIDYGRPRAMGRDLLTMISPGDYWRMGADAATTLTTKTDLDFGETTLPEGSYTLTSYFVAEDTWKLVIRREIKPNSQPQEIATLPFRLQKGQPYVEQMTIELSQEKDQSVLAVRWGTHRLSVKFSEKSD